MTAGANNCPRASVLVLTTGATNGPVRDSVLRLLSRSLCLGTDDSDLRCRGPEIHRLALLVAATVNVTVTLAGRSRGRGWTGVSGPPGRRPTDACERFLTASAPGARECQSAGVTQWPVGSLHRNIAWQHTARTGLGGCLRALDNSADGPVSGSTDSGPGA